MSAKTTFCLRFIIDVTADNCRECWRIKALKHHVVDTHKECQKMWLDDPHFHREISPKTE